MAVKRDGVGLAELARKSGAELRAGVPDRMIFGVAALEEAGPRDLSYASGSRQTPALQETSAGAVVTTEELAAAGVAQTAVILIAEDPELTFIRCLEVLYPRAEVSPGVDSRATVAADAVIGTAVRVDAGAVVGSGARIGAGSHIMANTSVGAGVHLGNDCILFPNVTLYDGVVLQDRVIIHAGTVIGADGFGYRFRDGHHVKFPQVGTVVIESDVEIGANSCVDRAALGKTVVGAGTKIDNLVQVAHNVHIGHGALLAGQSGIGGSSRLRDYVVVAAQSGITDHVELGEGATVLARTGVTRDVPAGQQVFGFPAAERRRAQNELGVMRRLVALYKPLRRLARLLPAIEARLAGSSNGDSV